MSHLEEDFNEREISNLSTFRSLKSFRIFICTWNVNTRNPNFKLDDLVAFNRDNLPDICVFGFQEVNSKPLQRIIDFFWNDPWTNHLTDLLVDLDYVRIQSTRLVGLLLVVFIKRSVLPFVKFCGDEWIRLGFLGLWGNKGANICALSIGLLNFTLVNCHLSAHQEKDKIRLIEHSQILNHKFRFGNLAEPLTDHEYLFLFGDLNFRTENLQLGEASEMIKNDETEKLLGHDQLKRCIRDEASFSEFQEHAIEFPPTYKFKRDTDMYDLSRPNRIPSWCDRILFKRAAADYECECLEYNSIRTLNQSDHKPVYGIFEISTHDWENDSPSVFFSRISSNPDQNLEVTCHVSKSVVTNSYDWIGVYDPSFKSSFDYLTYIWAPRIVELEKNQIKRRNKVSPIQQTTENSYVERKIIVEQSYLRNGRFILGYFSVVAKGLIGVSNIFELKFN